MVEETDVQPRKAKTCWQEGVFARLGEECDPCWVKDETDLFPVRGLEDTVRISRQTLQETNSQQNKEDLPGPFMCFDLVYREPRCARGTVVPEGWSRDRYKYSPHLHRAPRKLGDIRLKQKPPKLFQQSLHCEYGLL